MFIFKEGQRAYLPAWEFNTCRVLGALAEIVESHGGKVKPFRHIMANNRTYEPDAEPVSIYGQGYIRFTINNYMYYFQIDDNPFFDHYYTKQEIRDGKIIAENQIYAENLSREWMYDCLFKVTTDAEILEIAQEVFDLLMAAKPSKIARVTHKRKVSAHWEYETEPIKYVGVDF